LMVERSQIFYKRMYLCVYTAVKTASLEEKEAFKKRL
jgi:hypothetical protein